MNSSVPNEFSVAISLRMSSAIPGLVFSVGILSTIFKQFILFREFIGKIFQNSFGNSFENLFVNSFDSFSMIVPIRNPLETDMAIPFFSF